MSKEIDALVAEHVMGWDTRMQPEGCRVHAPGVRGFDAGPWSPSTDWRAAGEVVEKMRSGGVFIDVEPRSDRYDAIAGWQGDDDEDIWRQAFVTGAAGPEVICKAALAALRAKGVEVPK